MLNYDILSNKPKIKINDEYGLDLLNKTIKMDNLRGGSFVEVNEYYVARPDLISLAIYGDDKYADIICKINGISNPFELNEGQILFIPSASSIGNLINNESSIKINRINVKEQIANSRQVGDQKAKNEKRSPAQQIIGDKNYIIDKSLGVVFY